MPVCEKGAALWDNWIMSGLLTSAYAILDQAQKADQWKRKLLDQNPKVSIARLRAVRWSDSPEFWRQMEATYFRGLRKAGIPEA